MRAFQHMCQTAGKTRGLVTVQQNHDHWQHAQPNPLPSLASTFFWNAKPKVLNSAALMQCTQAGRPMLQLQRWSQNKGCCHWMTSSWTQRASLELLNPHSNAISSLRRFLGLAANALPTESTHKGVVWQPMPCPQRAHIRVWSGSQCPAHREHT